MKIAIYGYGNLGRGVEYAATQNSDIELIAVFTRRNPESVKLHCPDIPVYSAKNILEFKDKIDVLIICGGSATDLPEMTPLLAEHFNVIDSFDTHKNIPSHFGRVDAAAKKSNKTAVISTGWDPGMFSISRVYANAILPQGASYTFWGRGVSQGHSDAIRRIDGVLDARQYTVPVDDAVNAALNGCDKPLTARQKHTRECFVVVKEGADKKRIEQEIKTMPNYFDEYDTTVTFISQEELDRDHKGLPHGGTVIHSGNTGWNGENHHTVEYKLKLDSNPEFTASVLVACARAAYRLNCRGDYGCKTVLDIAPADLSFLSREELREKML